MTTTPVVAATALNEPLIPYLTSGKLRLIPESDPIEVLLDAGGEALCVKPLCWIGAPGGSAWRQRPLHMAFGRKCTFRPHVIERLDEAGIEWRVAVETESDRTIEATVSADLAVHTMIEGTQPPHLEIIDHGGMLPELPAQRINLYGAQGTGGEVHDSLCAFLRKAFATPEAFQLRAV